MAGERVLPGAGLTAFWELRDNTWKPGMDANLRLVSVLLSGSVISRTTALPGSGSLGDIYIVPSGAGSNPNTIAVWDGEVGSEAWVYISPRSGWTFFVANESSRYFWNGTDWVQASGGSASYPDFVGNAGRSLRANVTEDGVLWDRDPYDIRTAFVGTPTSSQVLDTIVFVREVVIPADMAGSAGAIGTNPTAAFDIDVLDDGVSIGTISISTGGSFSFSTNSGVAQTVAAGSIVTFVAPATADATAANMAVTIAARA